MNEEEKLRRICFTLPRKEFLALRAVLPHGTQDKLFSTIAIALIPQIKEKQREILGGIFAGEIGIELVLTNKKKEGEKI